jgi:hypothetical protein
MTAITYERETGYPFMPFLFLFGLVILAATIGLSISHAVTKHAADAIAVRNCIDNGNPTTLYKASKSKFIQICMIDSSTFGIRVIKKTGGNRYEEVTAYIKTALKSFGDVLQYVKNNKLVEITKLP